MGNVFTNLSAIEATKVESEMTNYGKIVVRTLTETIKNNKTDKEVLKILMKNDPKIKSARDGTAEAMLVRIVVNLIETKDISALIEAFKVKPSTVQSPNDHDSTTSPSNSPTSESGKANASLDSKELSTTPTDYKETINPYVMIEKSKPKTPKKDSPTSAKRKPEDTLENKGKRRSPRISKDIVTLTSYQDVKLKEAHVKEINNGICIAWGNYLKERNNVKEPIDFSSFLNMFGDKCSTLRKTAKVNQYGILVGLIKGFNKYDPSKMGMNPERTKSMVNHHKANRFPDIMLAAQEESENTEHPIEFRLLDVEGKYGYVERTG